MGNQLKVFTFRRKRYISLFAILLTLVVASLALGAPMIFSSYLSTTRVLPEPVLMIFFGAGLLFLGNCGRRKMSK